MSFFFGLATSVEGTQAANAKNTRAREPAASMRQRLAKAAEPDKVAARGSTLELPMICRDGRQNDLRWCAVSTLAEPRALAYCTC